MNILNMNIKHENHLRHIHQVRHAKHPKQILQMKHIYTTKGRDRFHWAVTPLKPHKVGNIWKKTEKWAW